MTLYLISCKSHFCHTVRAVSWRPAPRDGRDHREKENFSKVSVDSVAEQETLMQEVYFQ